MKPIDKRLLFRHILTNLAISALIVLVLWYTGRFTKGIFDYIGTVLFAPGFIILILFQMIFQGKGEWEALHDYSYSTLLVVSFIFYSAVIALIQLVIYKLRRKKENKDTVKNKQHVQDGLS